VKLKQPKTTDSMTQGLDPDMTEGQKYQVIWRNFSAKHGDTSDTRYVHRKWTQIGKGVRT